MWKKIKENISAIVMFCTLISSIGGGLAYVDGRYALASDAATIHQDVKLLKLELLLREALDNKYYYRKLVRSYPDDNEAVRKLEEAETEVDSIKKQINSLRTQANGN